MKIKTIRALWEEFSRDMLPPDCSALRRSEIRTAFLAGCVGCRNVLSSVTIELTEDEAVQAILRLDEEIEAISERLDGEANASRN